MDLEDDTHQEDKVVVTLTNKFIDVTLTNELIEQLSLAVYTRMVERGHFAKLIKEEVDEVVDNLPSQVFKSLEDNIELLLIHSGTWDDLMSDATSACEDMLQDVENKVTDNCIQYIRDNISVDIDIH